MIIYLDYVFFINFLFDFILLLGVSILLKRNVKIYRLVLGSLFGGISVFVLFFNIPSFIFFLVKMLLGIIMIILTFNFKGFKYCGDNFFYLIILSIILGGSLYLINDSIGYSNVGLAFFSNGKRLNIILLLIIGFILMFFYIKSQKNLKINYSTKYEVNLYYDDKCLKLIGFLDTGNLLRDPYFNKPIVIINNNYKLSGKCIYVPIKTVDNEGMMTCYFVDKVDILGVGSFCNVLVGVSNSSFLLDGVDIILNKFLLEDK